MPGPHHLAVFLAAAAALAVAPGPGMLYVLTRSIAGGRRDGLISSLGTFCGGLAHVIAAGAGLSALLAMSAVAFFMVKYAGAAYLIYLGLRMIRNPAHQRTGAESLRPGRNTFWMGMATEVLNPKTALFFLSFIPQFVDRANGRIFLQFVLLGAISVSLNTLCDLCVALMAGPLGHRLTSSHIWRRRQQRITGGVMIALGVYAAAGESA